MGTRKNRLVEVVLRSPHNLCFGQKYEIHLNILSENFHFLVEKFSVHLNRYVFIMKKSRSVSETAQFDKNFVIHKNMLRY